ncbi:BcepGomrgp69 [Burkholderia phage BcepGomr]|uniref:BcepGomrgp69 n=1 Tax=Burkholderia phage BcepGomr TaxID=437329 RepID=UPI0001503551|nr:BcepGomrgp69 [Burkholderia phage BcepGomr]ABP63640.1 BcepGomrgp69 [Burkholderia phage BcepGomr]
MDAAIGAADEKGNEMSKQATMFKIQIKSNGRVVYDINLPCSSAKAARYHRDQQLAIYANYPKLSSSFYAI